MLLHPFFPFGYTHIKMAECNVCIVSGGGEIVTMSARQTILESSVLLLYSAGFASENPPQPLQDSDVRSMSELDSLDSLWCTAACKHVSASSAPPVQVGYAQSCSFDPHSVLFCYDWHGNAEPNAPVPRSSEETQGKASKKQMPANFQLHLHTFIVLST